ncbi:hypothetical protein F4778DRAFT_752983 [Xylariomycetidae sp. FL2044]|nr:hypothetical protein F4778DRAFT_752983 [Xylariomycetidae sp. FL2044]
MPGKMCVMCAAPDAQRCSRCRSAHYCSKACQAHDWPSHKILCRQIEKEDPRPDDNYVRAIVLPPEDKPFVKWMDCTDESGFLEEFVGLSTDGPGLSENRRRGVNLDHWLLIQFKNHFLCGDNERNTSLAKNIARTGFVSPRWKGGMAVIRRSLDSSGVRIGGAHQDVTLDDYRHVLDHFHQCGIYHVVRFLGPDISMPNHPRETLGVQVNCVSERFEFGSRRFSSVAIRAEEIHPRAFHVSQASKLVGIPLHVIPYPTYGGWRHYNTNNVTASRMTMEMDPLVVGYYTVDPADWGNVLVIREDRGPITVAEVRLFAYFCHRVIDEMAMYAHENGSLEEREKTVAYVTRENMEACREQMEADDAWKDWDEDGGDGDGMLL